VMETFHQATNDNKDRTDDTVVETCAHSSETTENDVIFGRFEKKYNKALDVENQCKRK